MRRSDDSCPCGSGRRYEACCGPRHSGVSAPDAVSLMRSRYTAFVMCNEPYLLATWHPSKRPDSIPFEQNRKWIGLSIVGSRVTGDATAEVEFIARSKLSNAAAVRHHERSRFIREHGRWLYVDGELMK